MRRHHFARQAPEVALLFILGLLERSRPRDNPCGAPGTGSWNAPGNWTPSGPPTSFDDAEINNGGSAEVNTSAEAADVYLGRNIGNVGNLLVHFSGMLDISGIDVGSAGRGNLNIHDGGQLTSTDPVFIAREASATESFVSINGSGSKWSAFLFGGSDEFNVGYRGEGTVNVLNGGNLSASGTQINIGYFDKGTVNLSTGGTFTGGGAVLGHEAGGGRLDHD